ncbi:hypothetical protein H0H87_000888, partial [Tephrocybe sp. NHM501043]
QFPPPLNPTGYIPQATGGIDILHPSQQLGGSLDSAAIMDNTNMGLAINIDAPPSAQQQMGLNFQNIIKILTQNQTTLQQQFLKNQASLQQHLFDIMHGVAQCPNVVTMMEPAIQTPQGNSIKL